MWELLNPSSWTLTFDQALIQSLVVVEKGRLRGDSRGALLSTHSQCFIYGPLHFWLWWLQYLSSYLNCIFKDFIQYLHAIRYELIFFFFCQPFFLCHLVLFSYLIVIILAWFVTIIHKTNIARCKTWMGMFPQCFVFSDDSWTPRRSRCRKMFAGWAKLENESICFRELNSAFFLYPVQRGFESLFSTLS